MIRTIIQNQKLKDCAWYSFDIGNSAHALLVSTVGFSLYFKSYLFKESPVGDSLWAAITALILISSAILSPLLTSLLYIRNKRSLGLILTTILSIVFTALLSSDYSSERFFSIFVYFISSLGYYLALPIYNSYLPNISTSKLQKRSGIGWALGYLGGILSVLICFYFGFLDYSVEENPGIYRMIFLVAAIFNFAFSFPLLILSRNFDRKEVENISKWDIKRISKIFQRYKKYSILRLLMIYWLIGEIAVVVTYFFAIFLKEYTDLEIKQIMFYSIFGQFIAIFTTWFAGLLSERYGGKKVLIGVVLLWCFVPIVLFLLSLGLTYWLPIIFISLIIGSYNAIIRGRIFNISRFFNTNEEKGSLFGFFEVSARFSQIVGPLIIAFSTLIFPLDKAILVTIIFPIIAFILLVKYNWN